MTRLCSRQHDVDTFRIVSPKQVSQQGQTRIFKVAHVRHVEVRPNGLEPVALEKGHIGVQVVEHWRVGGDCEKLWHTKQRGKRS